LAKTLTLIISYVIIGPKLNVEEVEVMAEETQSEGKRERRSKPLWEYPANKLEETLVIPKAIQMLLIAGRHFEEWNPMASLIPKEKLIYAS